jgi:hypothetical protein
MKGLGKAAGICASWLMDVRSGARRAAAAILVLVTGVSACGAPASPGDGPVADRRALAQIYEQRLEATRQGNLQGIFAYHDRGFAMTDEKGKVTSLNRLRDGTRQVLTLLKDAVHVHQIERIEVQGDQATVWGATSLKSRMTDRPGTLEATERAQDRWQRREGRWWLVGSRVLASTTSIPPAQQQAARPATGGAATGGQGVNVAAALDRSLKLAMICYGPGGQTYQRECDQLNQLQAQLWARCRVGVPRACEAAEQVSSYVSRYQMATSRPRL